MNPDANEQASQIGSDHRSGSSIPDHDVHNFITLKRAFEHKHVGLVRVKRKSDGEEVSAVCAFARAEDGTIEFVPLAIMVEDDPYALFAPPNPAGGYFEA